jgi:hypothetical protein
MPTRNECKMKSFSCQKWEDLLPSDRYSMEYHHPFLKVKSTEKKHQIMGKSIEATKGDKYEKT